MELILLLIGLVIYFAPSIVAMNRGHHQTMAIVALNIFTGWTFIGWVAALVWSLTMVVRARNDRGAVPLDDHHYFGTAPLNADYHSEPLPEERPPLTALDRPSPLTADYLRRSGGN